MHESELKKKKNETRQGKLEKIVQEGLGKRLSICYIN